MDLILKNYITLCYLNEIIWKCLHNSNLIIYDIISRMIDPVKFR